MRRIVVGGAEYFWRHTPLDDWGCSHGAEIVTGDAMTRGHRGRAIHLPGSHRDDREPGWWDHEATTVLPRHVRRAIEIALRRREPGDVTLTNTEADEVYDRDQRIETLLRDAEVEAIVTATGTPWTAAWRRFVPAWLALGCRGAPDELLDDWVACRGDLLGDRRLQRAADCIATSWARQAYEERSAVAFLLARCERVGVAHGVDLAAIDAKLATLGKFAARPWGIPEAHAWWTK
jgi:hypothetical protein